MNTEIDDKAKELVEKFMEIETTEWDGQWCQDIADPITIEQAKQCAIICVDEILSVLKKLHKPECTTFIEWEQLQTKEEADTCDGYEYIDFLEKVKEKIQQL